MAAVDLSTSTAQQSAPADGLIASAQGVFAFPNRVLFGVGTRATLATELTRLRIKRPLVVTDAGLMASGLVAEVTVSITSAVVFQGVHGNPTEADVLAGLELYNARHCDGLIGLGGGSSIDAAKAIRVLVTHPGRLANYDYTQGGLDRITPNLPAMVAMPTTAGTGSEAGRGTLIQLPQTGRKTLVLSPHLLPSTAICDPELTCALSPELTAGTGMDALSHCVESFLATAFQPICDGIAVEGLRHVFKGLETAVARGPTWKQERP